MRLHRTTTTRYILAFDLDWYVCIGVCIGVIAITRAVNCVWCVFTCVCIDVCIWNPNFGWNCVDLQGIVLIEGAEMSSLSRELVFLILQFLDEEKFKDTVHRFGFLCYRFRLFIENCFSGRTRDLLLFCTFLYIVRKFLSKWLEFFESVGNFFI